MVVIHLQHNVDLGRKTGILTVLAWLRRRLPVAHLSMCFSSSSHDAEFTSGTTRWVSSAYFTIWLPSVIGRRSPAWMAYMDGIHRHFCNLFVSDIALPVKTDIKKPWQQHIQVRCLWHHESSPWQWVTLSFRNTKVLHQSVTPNLKSNCWTLV